MGARVVGIGSSVPDNLIRNEDLAALGYDADWIVQRTGILQRRHAEPEVATSDLAVEAARRCIEHAGVDSREIDALVRELNDQYEAAGQAYYIASVGPGYQMKLRGQFDSLTNRFYGRIREARLSQAAIDVLAIVAYNQPIVRVEVDRLRDRSSSAILSQLVRRRLLRIERSDDKPPAVRYFTTDRFLELFGLENLESLPRSQDIDSVP